MGWVSGYLGTGQEGWGDPGRVTEWEYTGKLRDQQGPRLPGAEGVKRPAPQSVIETSSVP